MINIALTTEFRLLLAVRDERGRSGRQVVNRAGRARRSARTAVVLVGSYELLIIVTRGSQVPADSTPGSGRDADLLHHPNETAAVVAALLASRRHTAPGPPAR